MRFVSFKILVLCILIPPVLYITAAYLIERHFQVRITREIEDIYTGEPEPLFDGSVQLSDAINTNIDRYLRTNIYFSLGLKPNITVTTQKGKLLYPAAFIQEDVAADPPSPMEVAAENFSLMNEGLVIRAETKFEHNRLLSNGILAVCFLLSISVLFSHYKSAARKGKLDDQRQRLEIERLQELEKENTKRLAELETERGNLAKQTNKLKAVLSDQKKKADRNEDDLIEEIESLEKKLNENLAHQKTQMAEIEKLRDTIRDYDKEQSKADKQRMKATGAIRKRFNTLYKNISIHDRAIYGFVGLNEELKIKAEEVIHQLNEDPAQVPIKRKVFGGKKQKTVFEVIFAYKGRFYFRNTKEQQVEVLAIGTKNTQAKELEFLSKL
jgi:hypothetical protein